MLLFCRTVMMPDVSAADVEMLTRMVYFSSEARMARATPAELRRVRAVASLLRSDSCIHSLYLTLRLSRDEGKIVTISNKYTNK